MKRQIRCGVFETNSSSTHSICICTKEDYDKWKNGEMLYDCYAEELVSLDDAAAIDPHDLQTYKDYCDDYDNEHYCTTFTTPSGDKMVAFGIYGYDS